jgi:hypothetical protein
MNGSNGELLPEYSFRSGRDEFLPTPMKREKGGGED